MNTITIEEFLNNYSPNNKQDEINKKEFEIYAFQYLQYLEDIVYLHKCGKFKFLPNHENYDDSIDFSLEEMLNYYLKGSERIYQMRRISDGKIFTVEQELLNNYFIEEFIYDFDTKEITVKLKGINNPIPISKLIVKLNNGHDCSLTDLKKE